MTKITKDRWFSDSFDERRCTCIGKSDAADTVTIESRRKPNLSLEPRLMDRTPLQQIISQMNPEKKSNRSNQTISIADLDRDHIRQLQIVTMHILREFTEMNSFKHSTPIMGRTILEVMQEFINEKRAQTCKNTLKLSLYEFATKQCPVVQTVLGYLRDGI